MMHSMFMELFIRTPISSTTMGLLVAKHIVYLVFVGDASVAECGSF
jgi:hypothetical protein